MRRGKKLISSLRTYSWVKISRARVSPEAVNVPSKWKWCNAIRLGGSHAFVRLMKTSRSQSRPRSFHPLRCRLNSDKRRKVRAKASRVLKSSLSPSLSPQSFSLAENKAHSRKTFHIIIIRSAKVERRRLGYRRIWRLIFGAIKRIEENGPLKKGAEKCIRSEFDFLSGDEACDGLSVKRWKDTQKQKRGGAENKKNGKRQSEKVSVIWLTK